VKAKAIDKLFARFDAALKDKGCLAMGMFTSNIHQKKPPRWPMPEHIARANAKRSAVRSAVERVFAGQKHRMASSSAPSAWPACSFRRSRPSFPR